MVSARYEVMGFGPRLRGRNGGGDSYFTDGSVWIFRLVEQCNKRAGPPAILPSPAILQARNAIWNIVANLYQKVSSLTAR